MRHQAGAAGAIQVVGRVFTAGAQVAQQRRATADAIEVVHLERHARIARHRQEVQHGVGRATRRGHARDRVLDSRPGENVARTHTAA